MVVAVPGGTLVGQRGVPDGFGLSAGTAASDVLLDLLTHRGLVEFPTNQIEGAGPAWVAGVAYVMV